MLKGGEALAAVEGDPESHQQKETATTNLQDSRYQDTVSLRRILQLSAFNISKSFRPPALLELYPRQLPSNRLQKIRLNKSLLGFKS